MYLTGPEATEGREDNVQLTNLQTGEQSALGNEQVGWEKPGERYMLALMTRTSSEPEQIISTFHCYQDDLMVKLLSRYMFTFLIFKSELRYKICKKG